MNNQTQNNGSTQVVEVTKRSVGRPRVNLTRKVQFYKASDGNLTYKGRGRTNKKLLAGGCQVVSLEKPYNWKPEISATN